MKKVVIKYGMYGVAVMLVLCLTTFFIFLDNHNWDLQEVLGYITIVLSLLFVFFGIKQWRDKYNGGILTFGKGLTLGTLISLFPSVAFGMLTWIEMYILDPGFSDKYYAHVIEKVKSSTPASELPAALQKIAEEKEMFSSPFMQFFGMFIVVFLIGFIITIISSLILRRSNKSV